jgi:hypothetical protein
MKQLLLVLEDNLDMISNIVTCIQKGLLGTVAVSNCAQQKKVGPSMPFQLASMILKMSDHKYKLCLCKCKNVRKL